MLGNAVQVTALGDYPALVVNGDIEFWSNNVAATILGSVICSGKITDTNLSGIALTVSGACVIKDGFELTRADGNYVVAWDLSRATFWDFRKSSEKFPITILSWKED